MTDLIEDDSVILHQKNHSGPERRLLIVSFLALLCTSLALMLAPAVRSGNWLTGLKPVFLFPLFIWGITAASLHLWIKRRLPRHDPLLLPIIMLLSGWGLLEIWRLTPSAGIRQAIWLIVAAAAAGLLIRFASSIHRLQEFRLVWLSAGLFLTGLTLLFGTNPSGAAPNLWFNFFGVYVQPSEPLRLVLVIYLAAFYTKRLDFLSMPSIKNSGSITPIILIYGLSITLLILQRDLGTAFLFAGVLTLMLYLATRRWQIFIAAGVVLVLAALLGTMLYDVVQVRMSAWLTPWLDPYNNSYQIVQALIAFASGGIFGTGPGLGSPGFVPAAHTDYIYTTIGEEFGFLGTFILISLYLVLISRGLKIALSHREPFPRMLASGITITTALQALLIMGGNVRLLPLTGVTLPFVSYGGSSLLTSFLGFGLLVSLSDVKGKPRSDRSFTIVQLGFMAAFCMLSLFTCWWSVLQGPSLLSRADNYRRYVESRFQARGSILDRTGRVLVSSTGEPGSLERNAPYPSFASLIGYDSNLLGQSGLEEALDPYLRGLYGYPESELLWSYMLDGTSPGGLDVKLTIDLSLQEQIYAEIRDQHGAAVVLDSETGSILALVSSPSFDSNTLEEDWEIIAQREDAPLLNRAVQGAYQPGSSLTPLLLAWQIKTMGSASSQTDMNYAKPVRINGMELTCALQGGSDTIYSAARNGCPAAALSIGGTLGSEAIKTMFTTFALTGTSTLPLQQNQLPEPAIPTELQQLEKESTGQGNLLVSPLQMARAMVSLQTGSLPPLHLIDSVHLPDGSFQQLQLQDGTVNIFDADTVTKLQNGFNPGTGHIPCFTGQAFTGTDYESLSWVTCLIQYEGPAVFTLVLENTLPAEAAVSADQLLDLPAFASP
ncbi:MAG: FtsW/RodA/SpoVE family cell cycle protein [Anaerolineales bacterium]|nr:FtsW/RodA/SpoVE family cell cycle protein [Anaerolineales bacterium]